MKLQRIEIDGLRRFRKLQIALDEGLPLVITGGPGSGRTSVLEAVALVKEVIAPYGGPPSLGTWSPSLAASPQTARIELGFRTEASDRETAPDTDEQLTMSWSPADGMLVPCRDPQLRGLLGTFVRDAGAWKAEYFPSSRDFETDPPPGPPLDDRTLGLRRLSRDARKYAWLRRYLESQAATDAATIAEVARTQGIALGATSRSGLSGFARNVEQLSSTLRWVGGQRIDGHLRLLFARPDGEHVELCDLTGGERMTVLFAGAFEALGLHRSLLLIDAPELGIHPAQQAAFFQGICALSPHAQIVAATTSPAILRSLPRERVFVLDEGT